MSGRPLPMVDLVGEVDALWPELAPLLEQVLRSGRFVLGPQGAAFEAEAARYLGVRFAVAMNSGTDALLIGLRALGVGPGDEVITSSFTFFATGESIAQLGATPVFADIDPDTFNLDPADVEKRVTTRTRALLPVHLFGQAADMDPLSALARGHGLHVLEDAAQAFGARHRGRAVGSLGDAAAFSFYPSKNLGAYGDGGLLVTDSPAVAESARMLRDHGSKQRYRNELLGYNSRLDEIQAAVLRLKLGRLDAWNEGRRAAADRYDALLAGVPGVLRPMRVGYAQHVFHQYTVRIAGGRRDAVARALAGAEIASAVYYPTPLHRLPPFAAGNARLPHAEAAAGEVISLPIWPTLGEADQRRVVDALRLGLRA